MRHGSTLRIGGFALITAAALPACAGPSPLDSDDANSALEDSERNVDGPGYERYPCGCIEDLFIQIAQRVPGFGGFWLGDGGAVIASVTNPSLADTVIAETSVFFTQERRDRLGLTGEIRVVQADYGFSDLAAWSTALTPILWWKSVNTLAVWVSRNRIEIGVTDPDKDKSEVEVWAEAHGIPVGALSIVKLQPVLY